MTTTTMPDTPAGATRSDDHQPELRRLPVTAILATVALFVIAGVVFLLATGNDEGETTDIGGQGGAEPLLAADGASLERGPDGVIAQLSVPTPQPGTYEYPTADIMPPWAEPHPRITPGSSDAPEVFTAWIFTFNEPALCTDGICGIDDLAPDAAARGGAYLLDGLIADGDTMEFLGRVRLGQSPMDGRPLDSPETAEVHVAITPHGRVLPGADGWRQLNGPIGNATYWWAGTFSA